MVRPYRHFILPTLRAAADGGEHRMADMVGAVSRDLGLSEEEKNRLVPGYSKTYVYHYVGWARTDLKRAGLLESPGRGLAKITRQGLDALKDPPESMDRKYLRKFPAYEEWERAYKKRGDAGGDEPDGGTETPYETIERGVEDHRQALYDDLSEAVSGISPAKFEVLALELLERMQYGVPRHTGGRGDGGVDGVIEDELGLSKIRIQCKQYRDRPVTPKEIREFMGALHATRAKKGVFITTSTFTQDAREQVRDIDEVVLIDGGRLSELMDRYGVGVSKERDIRLNRIDKDYFEG